MADILHLILTKADGTVVTIDGTITAATISEVAPPTITSVQVAGPATMQSGTTLQFSATVQGSGNYSPAVTWSTSAGTVSAGGIFTAPAAAGNVTITATSTQDASKSGSAIIAVQIPGLLLLPAGVVPTITHLDALTNWAGEHDGATSGSATGTTIYPVSMGGRQARAFPSDYTSHGGLRYHVQYATDAKAKNFIYSGDLWLDDPTQVAQMELDNNQVTADGKTYIFGVQCNANDGSWDITMQDTACHWKASSAKGNPKLWPAKTWLHFEIMCHRDDVGNITYDAVHFNGTTQQIGMALPSARALGWTVGHLLVNLQLGGANASGSIRCYGSNLQVARW